MSSSPSGRLAGFTVLVTGASSGIGAGIAEAMAREGAALVVNYRSHRDQADELVERIQREGGRAIAVAADVADEQAVLRMYRETVDAFGRIDVLVANSGIQKDAAIGEMTLDDWRAVVDVNLTGQFLCCREAVRQFRAQEAGARPARSAGSIICISSVHELIPWAGRINYATTKGGVRMMMQSLAQEVAEDRIRVNSIAPGAIRTPINSDAWATEEALQKLLRLIPYGRIGEPEDVARAAIWLASDDADYVTGTTLFVDGGMSLYPGFRDNG